MNIKNNVNNKIILALLITLVYFYQSSAQKTGGGEMNSKLITNQKSLQKWQDMRFGMFIHWGPISLRGTEIGWSRGKNVPINEYDFLYREFNPVLFNAKEWVSIAKAAGMKYLVITSKHHDGFCLWDTKQTSYNIMYTPFRRDVLKELSEECSKQGILFCTYYSILDWHHPHYSTRYGNDPRPVKDSDMEIYKKYLNNQIQELIKDYNTNMLWFDGQWEKSWTHEDGMNLYSYARSLKDDILINNRVDKGNVYYKDKTSIYAGDFDTPEQKIGEFNPEVAWESCITICNQWAWKPNDSLKSLKECIQTLVRTAGGGGNLLLNVGPMLDGRIENRQADRLKEIGDWLDKYGASIYGTKGGPIKPTPAFVSTYKENKIYVHVMNWPVNELRLPVIPNRKIKKISILGGSELKIKKDVGFISVDIPGKPIDEHNTVFVIELDKTASEVQPLDFPQNKFPESAFADIKLKNPPNKQYPGRGEVSLIDNIRAGIDYLDGHWLGFEADDFEATIKLLEMKSINIIKVGCLQTQASWIFFPKSIEVSVSEDGVNFKSAGTIKTNGQNEDGEEKITNFEIKFEKTNAKYIKVKAENVKTCPDWHPGYGGKAWIFIDEITVQ